MYINISYVIGLEIKILQPGDLKKMFTGIFPKMKILKPVYWAEICIP